MTTAAPFLLLVLVASTHASGQIPAGTVAGAIVDGTGARVRDASVSIVNEDTEQTRSLLTNADGLFLAPGLRPGRYRIAVAAAGFSRAERTATVEAGTTLTLNVTLDIGELTEMVKVRAPPSSIRRDHHHVGGVVTREQLDRLPLNGRNFLELAKVEPGVIPTRLADGRNFVSSLGAGLQTIPRIGATRITVDGANVGTPGTVGVLLQVSQDVVQEFQIGSVNFDVSTGATTNGAINVVTRSGTNEFRESGFYLYRSNRLAAYPGLSREPENPEAFFERDQFGASAGGPLRRGRAFFFSSFERTDQVGVASVPLRDEFAPLGGIFPSPYSGNQFTGRVDGNLRGSHTAFIRHSEDHNQAFVNAGPSVLPSSWSRRENRARQTVAGLTGVLSGTVVHELSASYFSKPQR
jgi:hypothetical protein